VLHGSKSNLAIIFNIMKKIKIKWLIILLALFIISVDFWNWNKSKPFLFFMLLWTWQIFFITILLSIVFYLFAKYGVNERN